MSDLDALLPGRLRVEHLDVHEAQGQEVIIYRHRQYSVAALRKIVDAAKRKQGAGAKPAKDTGSGSSRGGAGDGGVGTGDSGRGSGSAAQAGE